MANIRCPQCGTHAVRVSFQNGYKAYCPYCAWNRELARGELSRAVKFRFGLVGLAAACFLLVFLLVLTKHPERLRDPGFGDVVLVFVGLGGLPLYFALSGLHQLRKLSRLPVHPADERTDTFRIKRFGPLHKGASTRMSFEDGFPDLAAIPRPRQVKMTWEGWVLSLLVAAGVCSYTLLVLRSYLQHSHPKLGSSLSILWLSASIYGYGLVFFLQRRRERRLLAYGEVTLGHVITEKNTPYGQRIEYYFKHSGRPALGFCSDWSRSVYEGMTVPVFYDANNPNVSIPLNCALTKIITS